MRKFSVAFFIFILSVSLITGCSSSSTPPDQTSKEPQTTQETQGKKVLRLSVSSDLTTLDSSLAVDVQAFDVIGNTNLGLFTLEGGNKIGNGMVENYKKSDDGLQYVFTLRKDAKWSNGDAVTAHDFEFSWKRMANPKTGSQTTFLLETTRMKNASAILKGEKPVEELGVKATDDYTLEVELDSPVPFFLSVITSPIFSPINEKFFNEKGDKYGTSIDNLLFSGPYVLSKWQTEYEYVLTKNEQYFDKANVDIDAIHFKVVKDPNANLNLYETGELDSIQLVGEQAAQYLDDPNVVTSSTSYVNILDLNHKNKIFSNVSARKAFAYAIDKTFIAEEILKDGAKPADYFIPDNFVKGPDGKEFRETAGTYNHFDPQKAMEYWTKAKQELGVDKIEVKLSTSDNDTSKKIAEYVQSQLEKNLEGLKVSIEQVTLKILTDKQLGGDYDFAYAGWGADYADPLTLLTIYLSNNEINTGKYKNPEYDKIIQSVQQVPLATNPEERWNELQKAEKILMEDDAVIIPIVQKGKLTLTNPYVKNMQLNTFSPSYYFKNVKIEK
ncbi:peptide ABC transporter substrate-binding protein [Brevibacillus sp. NRS-1366]|uniref:peptide ABC transporter substrate-binding protein n=1 Tax=Brevibacillus sp. NRS-1366 TaxID=3233899 RepID=UPI003D262BC7